MRARERSGRSVRGGSFYRVVTCLGALSCCSKQTDATPAPLARPTDTSRDVATASAVPAKVAKPLASLPNDTAHAAAPPEVPPLRPGAYRLTLVAERGSHKRASAEGQLTLVPASASDKSPITGEVAQDIYGPPWFYGWTNLDFRRVGAPVCYVSPSPASRDPVRPGVLMPAINFRGHPLVVIGAQWNVRDGSRHVDGCGIALSIEGSTGSCLHGSWDRWGIVGDGSGTFRACLTAAP